MEMSYKTNSITNIILNLGIVNETFARPIFAENFTSEFNSSEEEAWARENEKSLSESLRDDMEEYVGKSLVNLMR